MTTFSICIPNYNYGRYIGETVRSVLAQDGADLEVVISDNNSTDDSVEVIRAIDDPRVQLSVNRTNVGFAGNLDRAAGRATGDILILLSSDDLMRPGALVQYGALFESMGEQSMVVTSAVEVIDGDGAVLGTSDFDPELWSEAAVADGPAELGPVRTAPADQVLRRCLLTMRNPFNFAATAFPRRLYEAVEGYGGGRLYSPDKWFHWRMLAEASRACFVERPLFAYRWHGENQAGTQARQGALKATVDDYVNSFEVSDGMLAAAGLERDDVVEAFVEFDLARHGLACLARGEHRKARRLAHFAFAAYPDVARRNRKIWALRAMAAGGPVGVAVAERLHARSPDRGPALPT